ncbi:MAG: DNA polymerase II [Candidatus Tectomicrobia bacterium]|nr:DNA polymerase II [Candidatus Tectomicrobia bacterium]
MRALELPFYENRILFGHNSTPGLIAFEREGEAAMRVFSRQGERTESFVQRFTPFFLLADPRLLKSWPGKYEVEKLAGEGFYAYLVLFSSWSDLEKAKTYLQRVSGKAAHALDAPYFSLNDSVAQHLMLTGQTYFLSMDFGQLTRLQLDIETYCTEGFEFSNPARPGDRIIAITLSDHRGWERIITGTDTSEPEMLEELTAEIRKHDPDIIEGHNLFRFDLDYIEARARRYRMKLAWGRNGSILRSHPSRINIAERTISYPKYELFGRHIADTWILAQLYDIGTRNLDSYSLKDVARYFGVTPKDRTYVEPERVSWYFDHDPETLFQYALDDVRETRAISEILSPSYFAQAQIFPLSYQNVMLRGNATKIDMLLMREYLRQRHAIPAPSPGREVSGGYTDIRYQGVVKNVLHCDITSLYPSIMLSYEYFPKTDLLGVFPSLLRDLREFRVQAKGLAREAKDQETERYYDALQATFKIVINSFYGYLGFTMGHFNDFEQAEHVILKGREIIKEIVAWLEKAGCRIIEVDTDGLYFTPPPDVQKPEDADQLLHNLARTLPAGINIELDGCYPAMFSYKMKNYALLNEQGKMILKGSGLKSRGLEPFLRIWMEEMLRLLLQGQTHQIDALLMKYLNAFDQHQFDVKMFMKTESLQDSIDTYREKIRGKRRNLSAVYQLAIQSGQPYQLGDQISYYVAGTGKHVKVHEAAKPISQWDRNNPDENVEYYKAKLIELYKKFKPFIHSLSNANS